MPEHGYAYVKGRVVETPAPVLSVTEFGGHLIIATELGPFIRWNDKWEHLDSQSRKGERGKIRKSLNVGSN